MVSFLLAGCQSPAATRHKMLHQESLDTLRAMVEQAEAQRPESAEFLKESVRNRHAREHAEFQGHAEFFAAQFQ